MYGIYIRTKRFCDLIMESLKDLETRNSPTLDRFIGQRVGIIRTGCGKPALVGYVTISGRVKLPGDDFGEWYTRHYVKPGSRYDAKGPYKYGYILENPEPLPEPITLEPCKGNRIWREV